MGRSLLFVLLAMVVLFGSERLGATHPLVMPLLLIGGMVGARLLHLAATPRRYAWRLNAEMYWPWGYVAVLFVPLLPILLCVVAQGWRSTSGRPLTPRLTRAHFGAYLAQGGDGPTYLSACANLRLMAGMSSPGGGGCGLTGPS